MLKPFAASPIGPWSDLNEKDADNELRCQHQRFIIGIHSISFHLFSHHTNNTFGPWILPRCSQNPYFLAKPIWKGYDSFVIGSMNRPYDDVL